MQSTAQSAKMGGLGANLGGEEWEKAKKKQEAIRQYNEKMKLMNMNKPASQSRQKAEAPREKTVREKALEYGKHVPKPKVYKQSEADMPLVYE